MQEDILVTRYSCCDAPELDDDDEDDDDEEELDGDSRIRSSLHRETPSMQIVYSNLVL